MRVLPDGRLRLEERAQSFPVALRWVLPVGPDRGPAVAQTFFVSVPVLGNDGGDAVRVLRGEPESRRGPVVEDVDRVAIEADHLGEAVDRFGDLIEGARASACRTFRSLAGPER